METENKRWGPEAFLVYDQSLRTCDAPFIQWLRTEGFSFAWELTSHGNFGCPWMYVNLTRRKFVYGRWGIHVVSSIGNHAITIEEFQMIYGIYKKYEGKSLFVFKDSSESDKPAAAADTNSSSS